MKINPDCVRDVMLGLEEQLGLFLNDKCSMEFECSSPDKLKKSSFIKGKGYSREDLFYSCLQAAENGYIVAEYRIDKELRTIEFFYIMYITPKGHDFIASISNQQTWQEKIKPTLSAVGNVSLTVRCAVSASSTARAFAFWFSMMSRLPFWIVWRVSQACVARL